MRISLLIPSAILLAACSAGDDPGKTQPMPNNSNPPPTPPASVAAPPTSRTWGETDTAGLRGLDANEIRTALVGTTIGYNPPGWADAGAVETYHEDGTWTGIRLSRGPLDFRGRWQIVNNRLCTSAESGLVVPRDVCRTLWRDPETGALLMEHMMGAGRGLLRLQFH